MRDFAQIQYRWAELLARSLAEAGVADVVVSPGSRSTPFVLAASREPGWRLWDVVDERAAAFFALGQARVTGRPSLCLCTSGTAGANMLPAVIEAGMSHTPLLVLTADRPAELVHCGANQTIDQIELFGHHARRFFELGVADDAEPALRALRRIAAQAVFAARWPEPGAVHLNARARKPLEPPAEMAVTEGGALPPIVRAAAPRLAPDPAALDELAAAVAEARRGLIVCGPAPVAQREIAAAVRDLARETGFPVLAEAASQVRFRPRDDGGVVFADAFDTLLHDSEFRRDQPPDLIVQIGRSPTSGSWEVYRREYPGAAHWVLAAHGWHDPTSLATRMLVADPGEVLADLLDRPAPVGAAADWTEAWREADRDVWLRVEDELAEDALSEGAAVHDVIAALPAGGLLALGNSLPIRLADVWARGAGVAAVVASQRGASGIDGVVSGAAGAASVFAGATVLLVGDVSVLHDLSGLATLGHVAAPLAVVVLQNRGGRIFEMLPLATHPWAAGEAFGLWTTPHDADFAHAAAVHGLPFARVETRGALADALEDALGQGGATVIEAVVPPHGAAEALRRLRS